MQKLVLWYSGHIEPAADTPPPVVDDGFAPITFADPPTSPGGQVHLLIGEGTRPSELTVVFVAANSVAEADRTPEILLGHPEYPQTTAPVDPAAPNLEVAVEIPPGIYDVGVVATYPDPA